MYIFAIHLTMFFLQKHVSQKLNKFTDIFPLLGKIMDMLAYVLQLFWLCVTGYILSSHDVLVWGLYFITNQSRLWINILLRQTLIHFNGHISTAPYRLKKRLQSKFSGTSSPHYYLNGDSAPLHLKCVKAVKTWASTGIQAVAQAEYSITINLCLLMKLWCLLVHLYLAPNF